jgi:DNA-binding response OmpR family regulator
MTDTLEIAMRFDLARAPSAAVARLAQSEGRIVSYGDLQAAIEAVTGNGWSMCSVRTAIKRARRKLDGAAVITTHSGMGYSLRWA